MKRYIAPVVIAVITLSSQLCAADNRSLCKKYFSNQNLDYCIAKQKAAQKQLSAGAYSKSVTKTCIDSNKLVDRKAVYVDYVGANSCAKEEQYRIDRQYEMRKDTGTKVIIK